MTSFSGIIINNLLTTVWACKLIMFFEKMQFSQFYYHYIIPLVCGRYLNSILRTYSISRWEKLLRIVMNIRFPKITFFGDSESGVFFFFISFCFSVTVNICSDRKSGPGVLCGVSKDRKRITNHIFQKCFFRIQL